MDTRPKTNTVDAYAAATTVTVIVGDVDACVTTLPWERPPAASAAAPRTGAPLNRAEARARKRARAR